MTKPDKGILTAERTEAAIVEFRARSLLEPAYCEELFRHATVRLLAHKYAYYMLNGNYISDIGYDISERDWYAMGRALGHLGEEDKSPCIDFDPNHPAAREAIELTKTLKLKPPKAGSRSKSRGASEQSLMLEDSE